MLNLYKKSAWIFLALYTVLLGCGPKDSQSLKGVQVLKAQSAQAPSEAPKYVLGEVQFRYLKNLDLLQGDYYQMFRGGEIDLDSANETLKKGGKTRYANEGNPHVNYRLVDGVAVARDYDTLAMFSSLYQFDTVIHSLPQMAGFSVEAMIARNGPIEIFFEPSFTKDKDSLHRETFGKQNASNNYRSNTFSLHRRSSIEAFPLSSSLEVIAHEFGHAVYDHAFIGEVRGDDSHYMSNFEYRGLNEGFADFFSFTLTGSTNILHNSFKQVGKSATLRNFSTIDFNYDGLSGVEDSHCLGNFYCIGTLFARSLYDAEKALGYDVGNFESRAAFSRVIIKALSKTRSAVSLPLGGSVAQVLDASSTFGDSGPSPLGGFFQGFVQGLEDSKQRAEICKSFISHFGDKGFPANYRKPCELGGML